MLDDSESDNLNKNSNNLSEYEQRRILNLKRNYEFLKSAGLPPPKAPKFAVPKKKNHVDPRRKNENESLLKNVTLKLFGVDKNSKVSKENFPPDSELRKYIGMVQGPTHRNVVRKSTKRKVKPKRVLDVTFLKVLLKDAEDYHKDFGMLLIQEKASENEQDLSEEEFEASSRPRYPKRNTQKKCYKEEDVSSEDEFLQCDRCELQYKGACPHHGPMIWVCDRKVPKNDPKRAVKTMPRFLSISNSAIPKAGLGVWTEIPLPHGFVFGPYKGRIVRKKQEAQKSGYAWQVWKGQKALHFVEGEDLSDSNWLRFVNCANREDQQNVVAFQYKRQVFYKTYKPILPYTEILVWYGGEYASDMGIDTKEDKIIAPPSEIDGFKCDVCGRLFSSLSAMERHEKTHPHMQPDRRHRCTECAYSTDFIHNLRVHLLTHSGERPHRCDHCDKRFTRESHLKSHLLLHTGEKPFLCSTCGRGFNRKCHMLTHERTHSGERPYRCQTCAKDFSQAISLEYHELTHTQQRPHRCPHCQYRSSQLGDLRKHIVRNHTKDYRHKCSICGKGFYLPSELKKHAPKHHSTETK